MDKIFAEEFAQKVLQADRLTVVDFFADWCGPCKMLAPVLDELKSQNTDVNFYKINIDENSELADQYQVASIPNVVFFKDGQVVDRSIGFKTSQQLQELIDNNL